MINKLIRPSAIIFALMMATSAHAEEVTADTALATINGTDITLGEIIVTRQGLRPELQELPDEALMGGLLEQLMDTVVLSSSAEKEGIQLSKKALLEIAAARRLALANAYMDVLLKDDLEESKLRAIYRERISDIPDEEEVLASHILLETEEKAIEVLEMVRGEDVEFAKIAKVHSTGPSASSGGNLGWFVKSRMVPPFAEAAFNMQEGDISEPVKTQFGWHIILVEGRRMKVKPSYVEMQPEIRAEIIRNVAEDRIKALREKSEIVVHDSVDPGEIRNDKLVEDIE